MKARPGPSVTLYGDSYDMVEDAAPAGRSARRKSSRPSRSKPGKYDLVLDPTHLWLTIHESVGHPLELDRVLGYEANYAGTSFATLDKWQTKSFKYGSDKVNLFADKTQPGSLGAVGYDDEGVTTKRWDLVKDGILVNYQAIRDQVAHPGRDRVRTAAATPTPGARCSSSACPTCRSRPARRKLTPAEHDRRRREGHLHRRRRLVLDRPAALQLPVRRPAVLRDQGRQDRRACCATWPTSRTPRSSGTPASAICDERDYRLGGSFFDGKGQPGQISAVSHGCATARFNGVNVINTGAGKI